MTTEIVVTIKTDDLGILFRMDRGSFDEKIIKRPESPGCKYLITVKGYSTLVSQAIDSSVRFVKGADYNLFLLFKFDDLDISEYRQQIKNFRLKYVFLAAKIIQTARSVLMKLYEKYP